MPKYKFTAKSLENKTVKGELVARDPEHLYKLLQAESLVLLKSDEIVSKVVKKKMKAKDVSEFSRQIADMVDSGIPVIRAIGIMKERDVKPKQKEIYEIIYKNVSNGMTLSEAMRQCGSVYPELFINMYASGESSGQLEMTARKMFVHYDKEHKLNAKVKQAMMYPMILSILVAGVVLLLFTFVLPQFFEIFEGMELPLITRIVMGISHFVTGNFLYILIGVLVTIAGVQYLLKVPKIRLGYDKAKLKMPVVGKLLKIIYTARFARTLASLYTSGINLTNCLTICSTIIGNKYIESQFAPMIKEVRDGEPLSKVTAKIIGFDVKLPSMMFIGEESGRLSSMLETVAESFDFEAEAASARMVGLMEPIMIVVMAGVIGSIMISVMLPLMQTYNQIK